MKRSPIPSQLQRDWYKTWFNTPYYGLLYQQHNDAEARAFIDRILEVLQPDPKARALDLACGKGRHARYLAGKGLEVTGIDLSINSIEVARQFENNHLTFFSHDMRKPFRSNYFHYVFNFFTSFGYFQHARDDLRTLQMVHHSLVPGGTFVLDFFNSTYVKAQLPKMEVIHQGGIEFKIWKRVEGNRVKKTIQFDADGHSWEFEEDVRLFTLPELRELFESVQLSIEQLYGNYQLESFDEASSPRLILIARKI